MALDKGTPTTLVLLDLSAAFDTISHSILLDRLKEIGVGGKALAWIQSFLTNRAQCVKLDAFVSSTTLVEKGVPQGSILCPTLFNSYFAPLAALIGVCGFEMVSYADDTQVIIPFEGDHLVTKAKFKLCMLTIASWMGKNFLQLNSNKTEILPFGRAETLWSEEWWPDELGEALTPASHARNLGVLFDRNLSLEDHIKTLSGTCFGILRMLNKNFPWIPFEARKTLIQALIVSRIDYGSALLVGAREDLLSKLQVVQNMAARMALNKPRRTPSQPLLHAIHWVPIRKRAVFKFLIKVYRAKQGEGPLYLRNKVKPYVPLRLLRSRDYNLLCSRRINRSRMGGRAFSYLAPLHWNKLPEEIRGSPSLVHFKKALKTWLFPE